MLKYLSLLILSSIFCIKANALALKDSACDVISLKNGKFIYCKIINPGKKEITYAPCRNPKGPTSSVSVDSVIMINFPDGHYQLVTPDKPPHLEKSEEPPIFRASLIGSFAAPVFSYRDSKTVPNANSEDRYNAGFANNGFGGTVLLSAGTDLGASLMVNYCRLPIDGVSFFNGNFDVGAFRPFYSSSYGHALNYAPITFSTNSKSYYYDLSILGGFKQSFLGKYTLVTLYEMVGQIYGKLQPINGTISSYTTDTTTKATTPVNCSIQTPAISISEFQLGLGADLTIRCTTHFYASLNMVCLFAFGPSTAALNSVVTDNQGHTIMQLPLGITTSLSVIHLGIGVGYGL